MRPLSPRQNVSPSRRAFSLVLSLTVMAMLLILCVGAAALLSMELRVAQSSAALARARWNAMAGARIALGEIQRTLGPDQRVSATAEILCATAATDPTAAAYYVGKGGRVVHPHWVGVWNAGRVSDAMATVPDAAEGERTKVVQRTNGGGLADSRFIGGKDWEDTRASAQPARNSARFTGWLVSGNEGLPGNSPLALTPYSAVRSSRPGDTLGREGDRVMLGEGSISISGGVTLPVPENRADGDYLGARAPSVGIPGADGLAGGQGGFAYWVADEGVKARANLANKYAGHNPIANNYAANGWFNLLIPQRPIFDGVVPSYGDTGDTPFRSLSKAPGNLVASARDIASLPGMEALSASALAKLKAEFFHDITFVSAGVMADVVSGGLRRDLTPYLEGDSPIPDKSGAKGSGISDGTPIVGGPAPIGVDPLNVASLRRFAKVGPRLGLLRQWLRAGVTGTSDADGVTVMPPSLRTLPSAGAVLSLNLLSGQQFNVPNTPMIPDFTNPESSAPRAPVLVSVSSAYQLGVVPSGASYTARFMIYPRFTVWNPYGVTLKVPDLRVTHYGMYQHNANIRGGALIYIFSRPFVTYAAGDVTLEPGQSISYVPVAGQDVSSFGENNPIVIRMVAGFASASTYYLDRGMNTGKSEAISSDALEQRVNYYWVLNGVSPTTRFSAAPVVSRYFLKSGEKTLREVDQDPYGAVQNNGYGVIQMNLPTFRPSKLFTVDQLKLSPPEGAPFHGFRMLLLDDDKTRSDSSRNTNRNPFVGGNFLATVQSRHPFDGAVLTRAISNPSAGMYTTDNAFLFDDPKTQSASATSGVPFLNGSYWSGSNARFALVDVPRRQLGVQSLGALQHVPFLPFAWGTGFPFGNALPPADDAPTSATTYSVSEEAARWSRVVSGIFGGTSFLTQSDKTGEQALLTDWSYELNAGLWDHFTVSGIPMANSGWRDALWDLGTGTNSARDSRYVQATPAPNSTYGADANFKAYRAAATLLRRGEFNVNSTSVTAWEAQLSAFRGVSPPGSNPGATNSTYSRLLNPQGGPVLGGSANAYSRGTWSGYRSLSPDEIRTLAQKIVVEVKRRGPFLGMSDFVNRRLKPVAATAPSTAPYSGWTTRETEFLGAMQAAIDNAGINAALTPAGTDPLAMRRDNASGDGLTGDAVSSEFPTAPVNPSKKPRSKIAGAPGYLLQSDVLQQLAPALSARSDTFVIRACGTSPEGATAVVEMTVQRMPEPLVPATASDSLPINPRMVSTANGGDPQFASNQFFGRRFSVVRTRWLSSDQI